MAAAGVAHGLGDLPDDCLELVLSVLSLRDACGLRGACCRLRALGSRLWVIARTPTELLRELNYAPASAIRWVVAHAADAYVCVDNRCQPAVWRAEIRELLAKAPRNPRRVDTMPAGVLWEHNKTFSFCFDRDSVAGLEFLLNRCDLVLYYPAAFERALRARAPKILDFLLTRAKAAGEKISGDIFAETFSSPECFDVVGKQVAVSNRRYLLARAFKKRNTAALGWLNADVETIYDMFRGMSADCIEDETDTRRQSLHRTQGSSPDYLGQLLFMTLFPCASSQLQCESWRVAFWERWIVPLVARLSAPERVALFTSAIWSCESNTVCPPAFMRWLLNSWPNFDGSRPYFVQMFVLAGLCSDSDVPEESTVFGEFTRRFVGVISFRRRDLVQAVFSARLTRNGEMGDVAWERYDCVLRLFEDFHDADLGDSALYPSIPLSCRAYIGMRTRARLRCDIVARERAQLLFGKSVGLKWLLLTALPDLLQSFCASVAALPAEIANGTTPAENTLYSLQMAQMIGMEQLRAQLATPLASAAFARWRAHRYAASVFAKKDDLLFLLRIGRAAEESPEPWLLEELDLGLGKIIKRELMAFQDAPIEEIFGAFRRGSPIDRQFAEIVAKCVRSSCLPVPRLLRFLAEHWPQILETVVERSPTCAAVVAISGIKTTFDVWTTAGTAAVRDACRRLLQVPQPVPWVVGSSSNISAHEHFGSRTAAAALHANGVSLELIESLGSAAAVAFTIESGQAPSEETVRRLLRHAFVESDLSETPAGYSPAASEEFYCGFWLAIERIRDLRPPASLIAELATETDHSPSIAEILLRAAAAPPLSREGW